MRHTIFGMIILMLTFVCITACSSPRADTSKYFSDDRVSSDEVEDITALQASALPTTTVKKAVPDPVEVHKTNISPGNLPKCSDQFSAAKKVWESMSEISQYYGTPKYLFNMNDRAYINGNPLTAIGGDSKALEERIQKETEIISRDPKLKEAADKFMKSLESGEALDTETMLQIQKAGEMLINNLDGLESTVSCTPVPLFKTWDTSKIETVNDVNSWGTHGTIVRIEGRRRGAEGNWYHIKLLKGGFDEVKGWVPEMLITNLRSAPHSGFVGTSMASCGTSGGG